MASSSHDQTINTEPDGLLNRAKELISFGLETVARCNILVTRRPWRPEEVNDLDFVPPVIRQKVQDVLTAQWNMHLPFLQTAAPAQHAAILLQRHIDMLDVEQAAALRKSSIRSLPPLTIIDFCSGAGGPIPSIERSLNAFRRDNGQSELQFQLSDLHPHLDAWMELAQRSGNLGFVPQKVDAGNPPGAVVSCLDAVNHGDQYDEGTTTNGVRRRGGQEASADDTGASDNAGTRVFRTFFLAFHHLPDPAALATLQSTLSTSDGFAIVELQDRRLTSFVLMLLEFSMVYVVALWCFTWDPVLLLCTFAVPIVPAILSWDGIASSFRTRTFDEVMAMVDLMGSSDDDDSGARTIEPMPWFSDDGGNEIKKAEKGDWVFEGGRMIHTFPFGHMNWIVGRRRRRRARG